MQILLSDEQRNKSGILDFDPDPLPRPWIVQNPEAEHWPFVNTGLSPPFHQVFLKRWIKKEAPCHELLTAICGKTLSGTPTVFGIGKQGVKVIYVYEFKAGYTTLDDKLKNSTSPISLLSPEGLRRIVHAAVSCFEALERHQYVYTDFNTKNMLHGPNGEIMLIDLDSAWSIPYLKQHWNDPLQVNNFARHFWSLWFQYIVKQNGVETTAIYAPKAMVLSFAAMYACALGQLNQKTPPADDGILDLIRQPDGDEQKKIWEALAAGDENQFLAHLLLQPTGTAIFEDWRDIFRELTSGRHVTWDEIQKAAEGLAALYPMPKTKGLVWRMFSWAFRIATKPFTSGAIGIALPIPVRRLMWDIGEGVIHGLIDPFWILRMSGTLKRKSPYL